MIQVLDNLSLGAREEKPSKHRRNQTGLKIPEVTSDKIRLIQENTMIGL
jgi:hypothetical protein